MSKSNKIIFACIFLISTFLFSCASKKKNKDEFTTPARLNILEWPGIDQTRFSCVLEKDLNYENNEYKCSLKPLRTESEICKSEEAFFSGPIFPRSKTGIVHPFVNDISLFWEGGRLQSMIVTLDRILDDITLKRIFKIPDHTELPKNIKSVNFQECTFGCSCIYFEGFEHLSRQSICPSNIKSGK